MKNRAFTLVELLVALSIVSVLVVMSIPVSQRVMNASSTAVSANNLRQLAVGSAAYLAENNHLYWRWRVASTAEDRRGVDWWFGFEPAHSLSLPEGDRILDVTEGPLAGYVPGGIRPDPSFSLAGKPFKPKYKFGYIGIGYNLILSRGGENNQPMTYWQLEHPGQTVVFATSAQVNTFQRPASRTNPMVEEFYFIDERETTVHFRHNGKAMVSFANGSAGFLDMDESTRDARAPQANIGRFAPRGSFKHLR